MTITARKAIKTVRGQTRLKRGGGHVLGESALMGPGVGLAAFLAREPTPAFAAQFAEDYERLLDRLDDATLRADAIFKLEGHTTEEIAARLETSKRTIDRKLQLIRLIWQEAAPG